MDVPDHIRLVTSATGRVYYVLKKDFHMGRALRGNHYQHLNLKYVKSVIRKGRRCLDVGASLGMNSMEYSLLFSAVTSFEPDPAAFELLVLNTQSLDNITLRHEAVSDRLGRLPFYCYPNRTGLSSLHKSDLLKHVVEVNVVTLDSVCKGSDDIDLIKIDVEGNELQVLAGAKKVVCRNLPLIQAEVNHVDVAELTKVVRSISRDYTVHLNTSEEVKGDEVIKGKNDRFYVPARYRQFDFGQFGG